MVVKYDSAIRPHIRGFTVVLREAHLGEPRVLELHAAEHACVPRGAGGGRQGERRGGVEGGETHRGEIDVSVVHTRGTSGIEYGVYYTAVGQGLKGTRGRFMLPWDTGWLPQDGCSTGWLFHRMVVPQDGCSPSSNDRLITNYHNYKLVPQSHIHD